MPNPTAAIIGTSAASAILGSSAASKAAGAQTAAAAQADATQRYMFDQSAAYTEPWRRVGTEALYSLEDRLGLSTPESRIGRSGITAPTREQFTTSATAPGGLFPRNLGGTFRVGDGYVEQGTGAWRSGQTQMRPVFDQAGYDRAMAEYEADLAAAGIDRMPGSGDLARRFTLEDFTADPGYEFRLAEGNKAIDRAAAARGGYDSGATLKALTRYGQDYATNEYGNVYNRWNADNDRIFNRLSGVAGTGQTASSQVGSNAMNLGANLANTQLQAGNARGAGIVGATNAITGAASTGINQFMGMQFLDQMKNQPRYTMGSTLGGGAYDWANYGS